jgi:hypothetical protein
MKTKKLMLALLLASVFAPVLAKEAQAPAAPGVAIDSNARVHFSGPMSLTLGPLRSAARPVQGAPYSAQAVNEREQTLSDGNQIAERHNTTTFYRDSAGRTRQEIRDNKGELRVVMINDPVAGAHWVLSPQQRVATKLPPRAEFRATAAAGHAAGEAARARIEQMRKDGTLPSVERHKAREGEEIIVKRVERMDPEARQRIQENVRIQVSKAMAEHGAAMGDMQARLAPLASAFGDAKWASKAVKKDLGTRDISGIKAEGKSRSYEIPAGEIGNRNPIVVSDETWFSPELQVTVYTRHSDPRSGDTVFRLENLKREEPAAALFTVPSDYTVKEPLAELKNKGEKAQ